MSVRLRNFIPRCLILAILPLLLSNAVSGATTKKKQTTHTTAKRTATTKRKPAAKVSKAKYTRTKTSAPIIRGGPWTEPTYADSTAGDDVDGEDLEVRRMAVEALGPYNGSVIVTDAETGRILTIVNQKLALGSGFQPCSTIKVAVALAALSEKIIGPSTSLTLGRTKMNLTQALALSNNAFFSTLGVKLGFEKVRHYARLFGYGEKAGLNIPGENPGRFPSAPPKNGGVGMLCSFGEEISQTPLQLAALMGALANGGTLYYLQYPRTQQELESFTPRIKRRLEIERLIPAVKPGMLGAVKFGTARRAQQDDPVAGKTGTCTESRTHLGWFGSYIEAGPRKLVAVVLLTGGRPAIGPEAAAIAGQFYKGLSTQNYFARMPSLTPASMISTQLCCPE